MWNFSNPHLKDKITTLTDEDWESIQRTAHRIIQDHPHIHLMTAEANAMVMMITEKEMASASYLIH